MNELEIAAKNFGVLDHAPVGICVIRKDYNVIFWNCCLEDWTKIYRAEIVGTDLRNHFPHFKDSKYSSRINHIFYGGPPTIFSSQLHKHLFASPLPNSELRIQHTTVTAVPVIEGKDFYALFAVEDVTEMTQRIQDYRSMRDKALEEIKQRKLVEQALKEANRKIENQLIQSEKMASIGQLAAGVAHEINNPTGFVSSNLKTLSEYQQDMTMLIVEYRKLIANLKDTNNNRAFISKQVEHIESLEAKVDIDFILNDIQNLISQSRDGTERIKKIVLELKDFAHPGIQKLMYADINHELDSTLNIVWNELKYKAKIIKDYGDLPEIQCYPQKLNQVFLNLLVNAAQAIEKEGEIRITTRADDGWVEIVISDTGVGITEENLPRIFDPFFTTKEVGKGTGLGLHMAYNIISQHNGTIDVTSKVGEGTTFNIRIPVKVLQDN